MIDAEITDLENDYDYWSTRLGPGHQNVKGLTDRIKRLKDATKDIDVGDSK